MGAAWGNGHRVNAIINTWIAIVLIVCIASITTLVAVGKLNAGTDQILVGIILGHVGTLSSNAATAAAASRRRADDRAASHG